MLLTKTIHPFGSPLIYDSFALRNPKRCIVPSVIAHNKNIHSNMTRSIDSYKDGMTYEIFMHRAFKSSDNSKPGMHCSVIQNLVQIESGDTSFKKWHGSFDKQFEKTKSS